MRCCFALLLAGCVAPPLTSPTKSCPIPPAPVTVPLPHNKADILFMIDNSPHMDAMQTQLRGRFGDFFKVFQDEAAQGIYSDLHIGVVTSDYGAGDTAGGGCAASPGGDRGILIPLGAAAPAGCAPPVGAPFIHYAFDTNNGPPQTNLPGNVSLVDEFTCMASVGAGGCGFTHPLESVYAALKNTNENRGFLRPDALLVVVFVTNTDDGSAAPNAKIYEPSTPPAYDMFRKTLYGVYCDGQPIPYGDGAAMPLHNCAAAPNPTLDPFLEYPIDRYVNFFTQRAALGGVKTSPSDVILVGVDGPEAPVETVLVQKGTGLGKQPNPSYVPCGPMLSTSCLERLQHSCQNVADPAFFADPAIRLNAVIHSVSSHQTLSICGDDVNQPPDYSGAMQQLGQTVTGLIASGCLPAPLASPANPQCTVEDVTDNPDGSQTIKEMPRCDLAPGQLPCWRIEAKDICKRQFPSVGVGVSIVRDGNGAPPNTSTRVECSTIPLVEGC